MTAAADSGPDLVAVHERLRAILSAVPGPPPCFRGRSRTACHAPSCPTYAGKPWGFVAATRLGKRYVSFYLMGVYGDPTLLAGMSPELRRRMQGKSCFNFTKVDEPLFRELAEITKRSIDLQPAMTEAALAAKPRR